MGGPPGHALFNWYSQDFENQPLDFSSLHGALAFWKEHGVVVLFFTFLEYGFYHWHMYQLFCSCYVLNGIHFVIP